MAGNGFNTKFLLIGAAILVSAGVGYKVVLPMLSGAPQQMQQGPMEVEAIVLKKELVAVNKEMVGRTNAFKVAEIRPQVSGIVTDRLFKEGSMVEQGQQLYQIDPASYKAVYESAQADLKKAKAKSDRFKELVKIDAVSKQEYDDAVASLAQAEADLAVAEVNLNYTKVYAPISGHIGKSSVTQGALVTNGQGDELAIITQLDPIYVDLVLPGKELMTIRSQVEGGLENAVTITDADGNFTYPHKGTLQFSEVNVDESTGTVLLRALFKNPEGNLLPGMFVRATVALNPVDAVLVPHEAAVRSPDGSLVVWIIAEDGTVNPHPIKAVRSVHNAWLVTEGLESGTMVVSKGFQKIQPGMQVKAVLAGAPKQDAEMPKKG